MHPSRRAQIVYLKIDKAYSKIRSKYVDFADIFLPKLAIKFPKHKRITNHTIELMKN